MKTDIQQWLDAPVSCRDFLGVNYETTRAERIADLCVRNGGPEVYGWGILSGSGVGCGLEQNDAIELMQYSAALDALGLVLDDFEYTEVRNYVCAKTPPGSRYMYTAEYQLQLFGAVENGPQG